MSGRGRVHFGSFLFAVVVIAGGSVCARAAEPDAEGVAFFERYVRPILSDHCYECHSANAKKLKGGLLLDSRAGVLTGGDTGPAIVPGKVDESLLIKAVRWADADTKMPPKTKLSDRQIELLEEWVKMGAPDPRKGGNSGLIKREIDLEAGRQYWAFVKPGVMTAPKVKDTAWPMTETDRFVLATLESKGLTPVADADRETLVRRVYFDLIGLPPTPQQVDRFLADRTSQALAKVVDELLASPRFGERWGRHWLDVARYAESTGMERNFAYPQAWRFRDYVIASMNADKPYDRFIREQVAGDLIEPLPGQDATEPVIATGFLAMGPKSLNEKDKDQFRMDVVDEQIDVTSRAVLGLTVSCARCHDHKFDPFPQEDYYALAGIFTSTQVYYGTKKQNGNRQPGELMPLGDGAEEAAAALKAHRARMAALNKQLTAAQDKLKKLAKEEKKLKDGDATKLAKINAEMAGMKATVTELDEKLDKVRADAPPEPEYAMGLGDSDKPGDCRVHIRGNPDTLGESVPRGYLRVLPASDDELKIDDHHSGRVQLAEWLTDPEHGAGHLAARVMVNRIWHHLFGAGIVRTVDNFGASGEEPSDARLLDHLATTFIADGWSVKKTVRRLVLSHVYRLSNEYSAANDAIDPDNLLHWRMDRRRLDAEALRDAVLSAAGMLELDPVTHSVVADLDGDIERDNKMLAKVKGVASDHRSVYLPIVRNVVPEMLQTFDFAEPSMLVGARDVTTVPTQALYMMNSPFVLSRSKQMAERLLGDSSNDDAGRVTQAYRLALCRLPSEQERVRALRYLDATTKELSGDAARVTAWASFCQALLASAEFRYIN
ncbi:MAG: DUF1549 domain-containing protein [Phycisphaera sp.]|nr:DUF1549 domain-containing protein [Phycisphaera sp.]